jgi:hypothetical protein
VEVGRKIYYEKNTGNVILNTGERSGDVVQTTDEEDFSTYSALAERVPETVGVIRLEYGAFASDYTEGGVITRIDLKTMEPLFTYPDPVDPETPQEPRPALSKQVDIMQQDSGELKQAVAELSLALAAVMGGGE